MATPAVTSITSDTPNGTYKAGDVISIQVNFTEAVRVTGNNGGKGTAPTNRIDTLRPAFLGATANANQVVLTYSAASALDAVNAPAGGGFVVKLRTVATAVTAVTVNAAAKTVTLTLSAAAAFGQAVTVAYADPTSGNDINAIQDVLGTGAITFQWLSSGLANGVIDTQGGAGQMPLSIIGLPVDAAPAGYWIQEANMPVAHINSDQAAMTFIANNVNSRPSRRRAGASAEQLRLLCVPLSPPSFKKGRGKRVLSCDVSRAKYACSPHKQRASSYQI